MNNTLFRLNLLYNYCDKNEVFEMLWTHKSLRFILMSTRSMLSVPFYAVYWSKLSNTSVLTLFRFRWSVIRVCSDSLLNKVQLSTLRKCRSLIRTRFLGGADHYKTLPRVCSAWSEMAADWKKKCDSQWQLGAHGVPMPDSLDWKSVFEKKPFERNLLQNPSPYGNDVTPYWLASATSHCII